MTADERIEKLVERMEALTETVELLASFTKDNQQMIVSVAHEMQQLGRQFERLEGIVANIADATTQLIGGMNNHELRIRELEAR